MKKINISLLTFFICFFLFQLPLIATEGSPIQPFEVGSMIKKLEQNEFEVKTKGEKEEEGVVMTPKLENMNLNPLFQVRLKGDGKVFLKIEETDAGGRFIKEVKSEEINLTNEWATYKLDIQLQAETSQLDVYVLTKNKEKVKFYLNNPMIK